MSLSVQNVGLIVGSLRRESINRKLASSIVGLAPDRLKFTEISLAQLPMYNGDLENDRPAPVRRFTDAVRNCDSVFIVMPEFNRSLPAVLKNAIDWGSKPQPENVWLDKPVGMTGISPGAIGTAVGQQHLRQILGVLGAAVVGGEAYLTNRPELFDPAGMLADSSTEEFLRNYVTRFADFADKLLRQ
ncbi:NAD(P)H-dependent oxidoreductase [Aldersonia sp. NBC_00410]|uniref:NADPH-dependent FMN reductase n=1 Tax=Aldersonia sp. NBC_00410 TaxID=2975954 RepID=UPI00225BA2E4|nr:NADPH-dependent FMN reductase [Aldersonia sp. NBC_00410]MCX5042375.1 NAD(P)H-dependent oxidoreductase [Aldersonia sp. NBC_00410]